MNNIRIYSLHYLNWLLLLIVVVMALAVVYTTHTSRALASSQNDLVQEMEQLLIQEDQLRLEEGTFSRNSRISLQAKEKLNLQNLALEQVVK